MSTVKDEVNVNMSSVVWGGHLLLTAIMSLADLIALS